MRNKILLFNQTYSFTQRNKRISGLFKMSFILILLALTTWQCRKDDFDGEIIGVCPEVIATSPENGEANVVSDKHITATFNEPMNPTSINESTFLLKKGSTLIPGTVTYSGTKATFVPAVLLEANTVYAATIKRESKDLMGNIMVKDTTWQFNTGAVPSIILTSPIDGASDVALNMAITAEFSTEMLATSINASSFIVLQGATPVSGSVSYSGNTATFTPTNILVSNKVYSATIKTTAKDLAGHALVKDSTWSFSTGILPLIVVTNPQNGAVNVAVGTAVTASFSKMMNAISINPASFMLKQGTTPILGMVAYNNMTATFTPTSPLQHGVEYTATITAGVKDMLNNPIPADSTWKFTTSILTIPILPIVLSTDPSNLAINVALNKVITATFSKVMDNSTINSSTFKLMNGTTPVLGFVDYSGNIGSFVPSAPLLNGTTYHATITTGAKDLEGNALANEKNWSFTTLSASVQYTVALSSNILGAGSTNGGGTFNAGTSVSISANANGGYVFENWTENGLEVSSLTNYTFTINSNKEFVANFTAIVAGPEEVNLGSAGNFAILAGTGVSNTGVTTIITGDVGSFPTSTMNGLLSGNVIGTLYMVADPIVEVAKIDLTTAYNDAQGRSTNAISLPGQLGGLTLAPGLYVNSSTSGISGTGANGILTLDAGGNPNAVWIFKMGSTLVTDAGTSIVLAGGAQAKNIYWSVGSSATLGTNSIFFGNILADQSITLTTGAELTGRALTRIGAITLDTNIVTKP